MKKNKQAYDKYFERNWNITNTWKGIKSPISLKTAASSVPAVLNLDNGDTITNFYDIANTFTNYFAFIAAQFLFLRKIQNSIIATIAQSHCYKILEKYLKN